MSIVTTADLGREPFLHGMREADLTRLATTVRQCEFPNGRRIFEESGRADRFWLIRSGAVALDLHLPGRGTVVIETLGRGSVLGWSWLFHPYQWRFGAMAVQPVGALEFDGRLVRTLCAVDPGLGYELSRRFNEVVVERLMKTRLRLLDMYAHAEESTWH